MTVCKKAVGEKSALVELNDYLLAQVAQGQLSQTLARVLLSTAEVSAEISTKVRLGALAGVLGAAEGDCWNVQGEQQQKLDVLANQMFLDRLSQVKSVAAFASEELTDVVINDAADANAPHLFLFDPLDGSSNIGVNGSVGSIFSVLPRPDSADVVEQAHFLQPGSCQEAAGYVLYGAATLLVLSFGHGVVSFALDAGQGKFFLFEENICVPVTTSEFSVNMSNMRHWGVPLRSYIRDCLAGEVGARKKDFNMRWVASMVADVHRVLVRGGVFLYPEDARMPGKLRLLYEVNPMSFLVEQAGGMALAGMQSVLNLSPSALHVRCPVILGSREEIKTIEQYYHLHNGQNEENS